MSDDDANGRVKRGKQLDPNDAETVDLRVSVSRGQHGLPLQYSERGHARTTTKNAIMLLDEHCSWRGVIARDVRAETTVLMRPPPITWHICETYPRPVRDTDITAAIQWMAAETGADFPDGKVSSAVELIADRHRFDPVEQYLEQLTWDRESRVDSWLARYLGCEAGDYTTIVGPKFLISAVAPVYEPGCQVDYVLVLEGRQGAGKTSALRILADRYHCADPPPLGTRDFKEALRGCWIVELGELESMRKSDISAVKNCLSQTHDHYRAPYARRSETHPRRVVFAATTNESHYLRDHTGNRRFWPVVCHEIDLAGLARDRDQLWAEATVRYHRGEPWHLTERSQFDVVRSQQEARIEGDPWEEPVAGYVGLLSEVTIAEILSRALQLPTDRQAQRDQNRVARILSALGFERHQVRRGGRRPRVYQRVQPATDGTGVTGHGAAGPNPCRGAEDGGSASGPVTGVTGRDERGEPAAGYFEGWPTPNCRSIPNGWGDDDG